MSITRRSARGTGPRRQWGSDRHDRPPLPMVAPPVSDRRITLARMAIVLTVSAWLVYVVLTIIEQFVEGKARRLADPGKSGDE